LVKRLKNRLETLLKPPFWGQKELFKTSFQYKLLRIQTAIKEGGQGTETEEKRKEQRVKGREQGLRIRGKRSICLDKKIDLFSLL
jgi:hypothetical protein